MFRNFWFYFNSIPVFFSVIFFSINFLIIFNSNYTKPIFSDAVHFCKDITNDHWVDYERTYQDKCIDEFMNGKENFNENISFNSILWIFGFLFSILGIFFIIPLLIYLLIRLKKNKYKYN